MIDGPWGAEGAAERGVASAAWRWRRIAEASDRFHATLDVGQIAEAVVGECVPDLAAGAVVHLRDDAGGLQPVAALHNGRDGEAPHMAGRINPADAMALLVGSEGGCDGASVGRHGASHGAGAVVVPLQGNEGPIGVLVLHDPVPGGDLDVLREAIAARAGRALATASLVAEHRAASRSLHELLAPPLPTRVRGIDIATSYVAAGATAALGGDFVDVHEAAEGVMAVLGDVQGHGVPALTTAVLCRLTVRTLAHRHPTPREVLAGLDQTLDSHLRALDEHRVVTACAVRINRTADGAVARIASAGHPAPVHVSRSGARAIPAHGMLLGAFPHALRDEVVVHPGPGDALVIASDGLTDPCDRMGGVETAVDGCWGAAPEELAGRVMAAVTSAAAVRPDDRSVLVLAVPAGVHTDTAGRAGEHHG